MAVHFFELLFLVIVSNVGESRALKLEQVVVLSRHNVRTPLTEGAEIKQITSQIWPAWPKETGFLTAKGAMLEGYMGDYFSQWLKKEQIFPTGCPKEGTVNIYANTKQRTKESAIAFTNSAFRSCNVTVNYKNITEMDPVFNPIIRNTSESFRKFVIDEMEKKLKGIDLKDSYSVIERILDYNNSVNCQEHRLCSLASDENRVAYKVGQEPDVIGPFRIGSIAADAFLMSYYEGFPLEDLGWGKINETDHWELITKFTSANQDVRFNMSTGARDFAGPLLKYIAETFLSNNGTRFTLLMGHDSNLNTVIAALGFKSFVLPGQLEMYPVGGKLVLQKFVDDNDVYYLKVEYVYLNWSDIREGVKLSLENPPQNVILELNRCNIDENGLCPWDKFVTLIKEFE